MAIKVAQRRQRQQSRAQQSESVPREITVREFAQQFTNVIRPVTSYAEATQEVKKEVDSFLEKELMPQIKEVAVDLLKEEIRTKLESDPSAIVKLREAVEKHKEILIKRKRGCIYLQFGTGTPKDPMDEVLIAST